MPEPLGGGVQPTSPACAGFAGSPRRSFCVESPRAACAAPLSDAEPKSCSVPPPTRAQPEQRSEETRRDSNNARTSDNCFTYVPPAVCGDDAEAGGRPRKKGSIYP